MVTHPITNRVQRSLTSLTETNTLQQHQTTTRGGWASYDGRPFVGEKLATWHDQLPITNRWSAECLATGHATCRRLVADQNNEQMLAMRLAQVAGGRQSL